MSHRDQIPEWLLLRVADHFAVLAQSRRVQLLEQLAAGPRSPKELAELLHLSQQTASKNLRTLHAFGVVRRRRDGVRVLYELADTDILAMLDQIASRLRHQLDALSQVAVVQANVPPGQRDDGSEPPSAVTV